MLILINNILVKGNFMNFIFVTIFFRNMDYILKINNPIFIILINFFIFDDINLKDAHFLIGIPNSSSGL